MTSPPTVQGGNGRGRGGYLNDVFYVEVRFATPAFATARKDRIFSAEHTGMNKPAIFIGSSTRAIRSPTHCMRAGATMAMCQFGIKGYSAGADFDH